MQPGPDRTTRRTESSYERGLIGGNVTIDRWRPVERSACLDSRRLQRVLDLIQSRLSEALSLAELAAEACLSPFHFSRLFREATGLSPHQYLLTRRIEAAKRLIAEGQTSMAEIALDTGFGSQANFSRTFSRLTGCTPRDYRRLHGH